MEAAHGFRPEIILCDIGLPGMDGYHVARAVRQNAEVSSAYMIALTGYGRDEDQQKAREAGFDLHLIKPIDFPTLRRAINSVPETPKSANGTKGSNGAVVLDVRTNEK